VYPVLFEIHGFPISSFGLMLAIAFLVGTWLTGLRMREEGLDPELATTMMIYAMIGGIGGSKLYFSIDTWLRSDGVSFWSLVFSREGITFYGGLLGGILAVSIAARAHRIPVVQFLNCACLGGASGQALGRIGCFLVGDDYGRVTSLPWGVAFPQGSPPTLDPVHPTQLYEFAWLVGVTGFLWWRRRRSPFLAGEYLVLASAGRFANEYLRTNPRVLLGLSEAQWIALGLAAIGAAGWLYFQRRGAELAPARAAEAR
jgi:phosphatidylglycerol---prolipoprotein diacylglyceryl transferase